MRTVVFFDIDGTLLGGDINTLILMRVVQRRFISPFRLLEILFWYSVWKVGIYDNLDRVARRAAGILEGVSENILSKIAEEVFEANIKKRIYKTGVQYINDHKALGHDVMLLSSAFEPFVKVIAAHFGITEYIATRLEVANGVYTGKIDGEVVGGHKHIIAKKYIGEDKDLDMYVYTDHYRDAALLEGATHPRVVNPDFFLKRIAQRRKWQILRFT